MALEKRWLLPPPIPMDVHHSLGDYRLIEREILYSRGIRTNAEVEALLAHEASSKEYDPFLLLGMEQAVKRLSTAVQLGEQIVVYGDYDADGITATALLVEALGGLGASVGYYIPNRFDEGYGLNREALNEIHGRGAQVVVTVDCGVRALEEVTHAVGLGLDVIVTDHHQTGPQLPPATAVINPNQEGDSYPFKDLAGVGVAYKLIQALMRHMERSEWLEGLDLVAIGTVADLVSLTGENRHLVRKGLEQLNRTRRKGLVALVEIANYEFGKLNASSIGFGIAPRLNAAGRLETADNALRLLLTQDDEEAFQLASKLEDMNRERQRVMREVTSGAREQILMEDMPSHVIFVLNPDFNEGVIGLAASRIVEEFYRPTIIATYSEGHIKASARSIPEFHITQALDACAHLLERYGGHSAAAGFSIRSENLSEFIDKIDQLAQVEFSIIQLHPSMDIDAVVRLSDLDWSLFDFIQQLEPCGYGNPLPVFAVEDVDIVNKRAVGAEGRHLKLTVRDEQKAFDAIAFRQGHRSAFLPKRVDIAFHLERSDYWEVPSLELNVLDIRPTGTLGDPDLTKQRT